METVMSKRKIIPFGLMPGSWGLSGNTRKIAEAEYNFEPGYDLDLTILKIKEDEYTPQKYQIALLGLNKKYGKISDYTYEVQILELNKDNYKPKDFTIKNLELNRKYNAITESEYNYALAELIEDDTKKKLALLELEYREGKIKEREYEKQMATLHNEPWVCMVDMNFNLQNSLEGSFELDWNDQFVKKLEDEGYIGPTPDSIINQWFMALSKNIALEQFDGTGDFTANAEDNLEAYKAWEGSKVTNNGRKEHK